MGWDYFIRIASEIEVPNLRTTKTSKKIELHHNLKFATSYEKKKIIK